MHIKMMQPSNSAAIFIFLGIIFFSFSIATCDPDFPNFLKCLPKYTNSSNRILETLYTPNNSSFESKLKAFIKNRRFLTSKTPKPVAIIAAKDETHVQATVMCAKSNGLQIRIRSGGHDYEGLSSKSNVPFVILDMFNLRAIKIESDSLSGWVQTGATLGELYYTIGNNISKKQAFPAGVSQTVGIGGHFTGGGYGNLVRKFGLTVDNVADARIVDVHGKILDRKSMGEDLFWAIRGGGGSSFGVILEWFVKLVPVPEIVTVFRVNKTLEQGATDIVYKWQQVAAKLDRDLYIRAMPLVVNGTKPGEKFVAVRFIGMFLGQTDRLLGLLDKSFPELGLKRQDCQEMSWIESTLFWIEFPKGTSLDVLLQRPQRAYVYSKLKSDFVKNVIPKSGLEAIWKWMIEYDLVWMEWNPYGGIMDEISESATPFPHRAGNLFLIQYCSVWQEEGNTKRKMDLLRKMHKSMSTYVSRNPREAFQNYRDNDIGSNRSNFTDVGKAEIYGRKYYKNNFERLAKVKAKVDPDNYFKHEQSIPPLFSS